MQPRRASSREFCLLLKLLDANVLMHLANRADGHALIVERLAEQVPGTVMLSAITVAELHYKIGLRDGKKPPRRENVDRLERWVHFFGVIPFDEAAGQSAAAIRCALEFDGTPIGLPDTFLAGHALAAGATLVTDNVGEFTRVSGLRIENWRRA